MAETGSSWPCALPCTITTAAILTAVVKLSQRAAQRDCCKLDGLLSTCVQAVVCILMLKDQAGWDVSGREKVNMSLASREGKGGKMLAAMLLHVAQRAAHAQ